MNLEDRLDKVFKDMFNILIALIIVGFVIHIVGKAYGYNLEDAEAAIGSFALVGVIVNVLRMIIELIRGAFDR